MQRTLARSISFCSAVFIVVGFLVWASPAYAQCEFSACTAGETYNPSGGACESNSGFPTYAMSHRIPTCNSSETFVRATGMCRINDCGGSCRVRPACGGEWPVYSGSGTDGSGVYARCDGTSHAPAPMSHITTHCTAGFTLNTARGVCISCAPPLPPPPAPRFADLLFRAAFLRQTVGGPSVPNVHRGRPYLACFTVANVGDAPSAPFVVRGGGLGVPTTPTQAHAGLAPGATRDGCLVYPTTPVIGSYRLGIEVDSGHAVAERVETNNTSSIPVTVVP
jgi:hypothetical protein